MSTPQRADPTIYPKMRENALKLRLGNLPDNAVHALLMDWQIGNGTMTVLAAADGTASVYLSSGGGFIGGGQKYPAIHDAALHAIHLATDLVSMFESTEAYDLPAAGNVFFYLTTSKDVRRAVVKEADLISGRDPLAGLGAMMQEIITQYRLNFPCETPN
jgi:hypothetical protein